MGTERVAIRAVLLVVASVWLLLRLRLLSSSFYNPFAAWWIPLGIAAHLCLDGCSQGWPAVMRVLREMSTAPSDGPEMERVFRQLARLNCFLVRYSGLVLFSYLVLPAHLIMYLLEDLHVVGPQPSTGLSWLALIGIGSLAFCTTVHLTSHRYFAHLSFRASRPVQALLGVAAAATGQGGPLEWASTHVRHHRECDGAHDPHSPGRQGWLEAHVLWLTRSEYFLIEPARLHTLMRACPELWFCDVFSFELHQLLMQLLRRVLSLVLPADADARVLLNVAHALSLHATSLTNSCCHSRLVPDRCAAIDVRWVALLNGGEGWHRHHHDDPLCAHHGFVSGGLDVVYLVICALERLGLVRDVRHGRLGARRAE